MCGKVSDEEIHDKGPDYQAPFYLYLKFVHSLMKKIILYYSLLLFPSLVYADNYLGYVRQIDASFCMDVCSEYYLEGESGEYIINITFAFGSYDPSVYLDRFVEVEGEEIWCVECGAIEIEEINFSDECENPVFCFADPCEVAPECQLNTPVECVSNYCGGCYADFYDLEGNPVDCYSENIGCSIDQDNDEIKKLECHHQHQKLRHRLLWIDLHQKKYLLWNLVRDYLEKQNL